MATPAPAALLVGAGRYLGDGASSGDHDGGGPSQATRPFASSDGAG